MHKNRQDIPDFNDTSYIQLLERSNTDLYARIKRIRTKNILLSVAFLLGLVLLTGNYFMQIHQVQSDIFEGHLPSTSFTADKLLIQSGQGKYYEITDSTQVKWVARNNMIINVDNQHIAFSFVKNNMQNYDADFTLFVPEKHFKLRLADGTEILLNKHSKIQFNNQRGKDVNSATLEGEAYFNVAHQEGNIFNIKASDARISVYGTEFNIANDGHQTRVALINGSIKLSAFKQEQMIKPGQEAIVDARNKDLKVQYADIAGIINWTDKQLSFKEKSLGEILHKISKWYHVDFKVFDRRLLQKHYTGIINKKDGLLHFLQLLQYTEHINFVINDKFVTLTN